MERSEKIGCMRGKKVQSAVISRQIAEGQQSDMGSAPPVYGPQPPVPAGGLSPAVTSVSSVGPFNQDVKPLVDIHPSLLPFSSISRRGASSVTPPHIQRQLHPLTLYAAHLQKCHVINILPFIHNINKEIYFSLMVRC